MNLMDKIRKESEMPSIVIDKREDPLFEDLSIEQDMLNTPLTSQSISLEESLLKELEKIPQISSKKVGVRLEEAVLTDIQNLCRDNNITVETLLEAFYEVCNTREPIMKLVVKEAQTRMKSRTRAGNIRSTLTKFRNIQKH
jgi:predicted DNA-binding ribbon-helix-helix protein